MTRNEDSDDLRVAVAWLRALPGWNQTELARAAHIDQGQISLYEHGKRVPTRQTLEKLAAVAGVPISVLDSMLSFIHLVRASLAPLELSVPSVVTSAKLMGQRVSEAVSVVSAPLLANLTRPVHGKPDHPTAPSPDDRRSAEKLWARLQSSPPQNRRLLVEWSEAYRSWALAEILCDQSLEAAPADAARAAELATLAVEVASRMSGAPSWSSRVQGFCYAHLGNARRLANDLPAADLAFAEFERLWQAGVSCGENLLDEARVLDFEASLRCGQRRFPEALRLHDRALAVARHENLGALLLNKAFTQEQGGNSQHATETLMHAAPLVERQENPRLLFALLFQRTGNLCHEGKHQEASSNLAKVRDLAIRLGNKPDLLRVRGLEARVAAGQGHPEEALAALAQAREGFIALDMPYDAALATLEIAVLFAEHGCAREVRELARQTAPLFRAQGVARETLGALKLFREAAEREALTAELARRLRASLASADRQA